MKRFIVVALTVIGMFFMSGSVQAEQVYNPTNGHYYEFIDNQMTWSEAKTYCQSNGGYLVTITSQDENDFVYDFVFAQNSGWLGGTDENTEGTWEWVTGEIWSYTNWLSGEPNNRNDEDYLVWYDSGEWNDGHSYDEQKFVCEWDNICYTQSDLDAQYQAGVQSCIDDPSSCGITQIDSDSILINSDLSFSFDGTYSTLFGDMDLTVNFKYFGEQSGKLLWELDSYTVE